MPAHNVQVAGSWTGDGGGLSVEEGLAQTLGLTDGDGAALPGEALERPQDFGGEAAVRELGDLVAAAREHAMARPEVEALVPGERRVAEVVEQPGGRLGPDLVEPDRDVVAAELVGAIAGLGQILNQAAQDIYPAMILVGMISVALCGWLMTLALGWIEQRVMPWKAR